MDHSPRTGSRRAAIVALVGAMTFGCLLGVSSPVGAADGDLTAVLLKDVNPGTTSSTPTGFVQVGTSVLFLATDTTAGQELRKTDGTPAGTTLLKDINPGAASSGTFFGNQPGLPGTAQTAQVLNGYVYFGANDGSGIGNELWRSDGTAAGTSLVKDINPGAGDSVSLFAGPSSAASEFRVIGETLYFTANDGTAGTELWKTDGTAAGTVLLMDINPGPVSSFTASSTPMLTAVGSTLFFQANNGTTGGELWKSDGTAGGTVLVKDINPGTGGGALLNLTALGTDLVFRAFDGSTGNELWKSDGTLTGTVQVMDINPGPNNSQPNGFTVLDSTLFFSATDGAIAPASGTELWKSDGTTAGTVMVKDINPGTLNSQPNNITPFGDVVLLRATVSGTGGSAAELWKSDGTEAGTVLVKDIAPGASSAGNPINFGVLGSTAYFSASSGPFFPSAGTELWKTDGTEAGTVLVRDINPGTTFPIPNSNPSLLTPALGTIFFSATSGTTGAGTGVEPYYLRPNYFPIATADSYFTTEETPLTVPAPGVLGNDSDPDGDPVSAGSASTPTNGTVSLSANGSFTYTPNANFAGTDTFTYSASDGLGGSATGTVTITVNGTPDAPVAGDDTYSTDEDTPLTVNAPGVLGKDTDPDGDPLSAGSASDPANGSVVLNGDGSFTYTPDAGSSGSDSFTYTVSDGNGGTDEGLVSITVNSVNDAPDAVDDAYSTSPAHRCRFPPPACWPTTPTLTPTPCRPARPATRPTAA